MKIATADRKIDRISTSTERQFTIKATGKAFRILSSGLYKDKILAIVRELSCNAYDAHVSIGKGDVPFDVHLPNPLEPFFSVRDYGPALSPFQIETVFTTYFESTKTDDNDQIGGLGLGCKSPLSYGDSFTVISRHEGFKRTYTVFFNETDTPSMTLMSEEKTTERTGLEVKLSVHIGDNREFKERAEKVFRFFPLLPNVTGDPHFKVTPPEPIISGSDYDLCRSDGGYAKAIMGVVAYPLDHQSTGLAGAAYRLLSNSVYIRFPVGDLDITAGREELSYIPLTKERIQERVNGVLNDLPRRVLREFRKCKTEFEARRLYGKIVQGTIVNELLPEGKIPYRNMLIGSSTFVVNFTNFNSVTILHYDRDHTRARFNAFAAGCYNNECPILASDNLKIIIDDLNGRTSHNRVRQFRNENHDANVFLIRANDPQQLVDLLKFLDGVETTLISTLPKLPKKERQPTSVLALGNWERTRGTQIKRDSWERTIVDPSEGGIYVSTSSGTIRDKNGIPVSNFSNFYKLVLTLQLFDTTQQLYSIPKSLLGSFEADEGWVDFFTHVTESFKQKMVAEAWSDEIGKAKTIAEFANQHSRIVNERNTLSNIVNRLGDHPLKEFIDLWRKCDSKKSYVDHQKFSEQMGIFLAPSETFDLCEKWEIVGTKYKLLDYMFGLSRWNRNEEKFIADAVEYIQQCDSVFGTNCIRDTE